MYTHEAALLVGGTPTDRPEDVEITPIDGTIYIAHTNNDNHGNFHGHITRFIEDNNDLASLNLILKFLLLAVNKADLARQIT